MFSHSSVLWFVLGFPMYCLSLRVNTEEEDRKRLGFSRCILRGELKMLLQVLFF